MKPQSLGDAYAVQDRLFTLLGDIGNPAPDSRVTVEGTIAQTSICNQGITIAVTKIRVEPQR